ncbi:MAG: ATP-binding protein [Phycisphaeraceae bacterium]|nr:ATP-binding protein [Phycisphaeraceae bacterium]
MAATSRDVGNGAFDIDGQQGLQQALPARIERDDQGQFDRSRAGSAALSQDPTTSVVPVHGNGSAIRTPVRLPGRDADAHGSRVRLVHPGRATPPMPPFGGNSSVSTEQPDGPGLEAALKHLIGQHLFDRYFASQAVLERTDAALVVGVASSFLAPILERRFGSELSSLAEGKPVRFVERPEVFAEPKSSKSAKVSTRTKPQALAPKPHPPLRDRTLRLDDFVVGQSNRLAHAAAMSLSDPSTTPRAGNMLVLYGGCGLGKTHLLRGMAHNYNRLRGSGGKARYVTAEHFTNGFLSALRTSTTDRFREQYRGVELLCLDDVHFLATKEATKAELLHTLDQILQSGCRLALASDEHPRHVQGLGKQLVSRLLGGLTIELGTPDRELQEQMVRRLAARRGLGLDDQVVTSIADAVIRNAGEGGGSFRDIEGALARVDAFHNLLGRVGGASPAGGVSLSTVIQALGLRPEASSNKAGPIRVETVIEVVCKSIGVGHAEFVGRGRHKRVVLARALVSHISRQLTTASYPEIASAMGRPNHSSIITAHRRIEKQIHDEDRVEVGCEADGQTIAELARALATRIRTNMR